MSLNEGVPQERDYGPPRIPSFNLNLKADLSPFYEPGGAGTPPGRDARPWTEPPPGRELSPAYQGDQASRRSYYVTRPSLRPSLGWDFLYTQFPKDLVNSTIRLISSRNTFWLAAGIGSAINTMPNDRETSDFMVGYADRNMAPLNFWGDPFVAGAAPVGIFIASRFLEDPKLEKLAVILGETMALGDGLGTLIRMSVHRTKPNRATNWSFPSGHTFHAFALATSIQEVYGYKYGVPAYMVAAGTAFARVYDRQHYPSDVLAGAILGVATAWSVYDAHEGNERKYAILPLTVTEQHGFGIQFVIWD